MGKYIVKKTQELKSMMSFSNMFQTHILIHTQNVWYRKVVSSLQTLLKIMKDVAMLYMLIEI